MSVVTSTLSILEVSDVSPAVVRGGGERVLWEQAWRLAARGHRVRIVSRSADAGAPAPPERQGVSIREFPVDRGSLLRFIVSSIREARRAGARALEEAAADVLHVHQPLAGYGVLGSRAGRGIPSLYTFHSPAPLEYRSRRGMTGFHRGRWLGALGTAMLWVIERACLRRATRVHVLSEFSSRELQRLYRVARERIVKIPGGVDPERFRPVTDRRQPRRALGLPLDRPLVLTVRNLESRMGLDTLIRATAIVRRAIPEILLLIGGTGSLRESLQSLVHSLDLAEHVRFPGFVPEAELPAYYQAADAFVLPTRELEGFGLVTVEALACGTPVLGTPVGATPEILRPVSETLVFRDRTPEAMADGIRRFFDGIAGDETALGRLRRACRSHVEASYGWEDAIASLEDVLGGLAARARGVAS